MDNNKIVAFDSESGNIDEILSWVIHKEHSIIDCEKMSVAEARLSSTQVEFLVLQKVDSWDVNDLIQFLALKRNQKALRIILTVRSVSLVILLMKAFHTQFSLVDSKEEYLLRLSVESFEKNMINEVIDHAGDDYYEF